MVFSLPTDFVRFELSFFFFFEVLTSERGDKRKELDKE